MILHYYGFVESIIATGKSFVMHLSVAVINVFSFFIYFFDAGGDDDIIGWRILNE